MTKRLHAMIDHMTQRLDVACREALGVGDGPIDEGAARRAIMERKLAIVRVGGIHETYEVREGPRALWRGGWRSSCVPWTTPLEWHEEWL